jgi:SAM-dependent methyltransferase
MKPLNLVQGKAEDMKFEDESFDIINCVYLFHEIPRDVRKQCAKEFFRVLRPGGIVAFNDSIQDNDRETLPKEVMKAFPEKYHEPYYMDYFEDDINAIFTEAGFVKGPCDPIIANRSKVMSWVKPGTYEVPIHMMSPEGRYGISGKEYKPPMTAAAEIKSKVETRKENKKDYMKARSEKIREKMSKRRDEFKQETDVIKKRTEEIIKETEAINEKVIDEVGAAATKVSETLSSKETLEKKMEKVVEIANQTVKSVT